MIRQVSLDHGWYYHYRLHQAKLGLLKTNGFSHLHTYLDEVFNKCPQEPFLIGPRGSQLKFSLGIKPRQVDNHEVSVLAKEGLHWNKYNNAHSNVQVFMLSYDNKTLGAEVPIWLRADEFGEKKFDELFSTKEPLSGHIDVLRLEDDKLWVWDYKPRAEKEKYASTQTFFYALMLSKRTGISLDKFMCGYFDDETSFVFKPKEKYIKEKQMTLK
ncbi:MAG TPA: PD-(D/E)XK nuclease family protein [Candidatus Nanoarchaeia archaeon]|nr:PD-(D/E)XK nuclease family protein [Candidatus Nanoarchaeia archaeon]